MYEQAGFEVRGLEGGGDHLCFRRSNPNGYRSVSIFSEVKRQERVQLPAWLAQAKAEAPSGTIPVVSWRRNRGEWYAVLPLRDLLRLV